MLNDLIENEETELLRSILRRYSYSFYVCWLPADSKIDSELDLKSYFGNDCVIKCLTRVETKTYQLASDLNTFCEEFNLEEFNEWLKFENIVGCLINNIKP